MDSVSYLNPAELHSNPAFTQAVRIPAGHDLIVIGGQNGVDSSGRVVSDDIAGQTRQALSNLQVCLQEAKTDLDHVVRWSIMIKDGAPLLEGLPRSWRSGASGQPAGSVRRHGQRLCSSRCPVRNRGSCGGAQHVKYALSLSKREVCPSTDSGHRLIKMPCGGCVR
jgi:enamine deaminase RidA (YjgF/YER057c/UK114 family)